MDREELRPCKGCGAPCDGDLCDARCEDLANHRAAVAYMVEVDVNDGVSCSFYCPDCARESEMDDAEPLNKRELLGHRTNPFNTRIDCEHCEARLQA